MGIHALKMSFPQSGKAGILLDNQDIHCDGSTKDLGPLRAFCAAGQPQLR
ncbi:hypothetical protein [Cognatishimia sp. F0-27]|nr:hypothetical protein [Cognatishimia sp. F0-27]